MTIRDEPVYPMSVSERLTGLSRRQIRYYERAGLLRPYRTAGGHRLYTPAEIETLQTIKLLGDRGYRTVEAMRRRLSAMAAAQSRQSAPEPEASARRGPGENDSQAYFGRVSVLAPRPPVTPAVPPRTHTVPARKGV